MADTEKREAMIEMLVAFDRAMCDRGNKWREEALKHRKTIVVNPRQAKQDAKRLFECKVRADEIQSIRKLIVGTIETCQEQNKEEKADGQGSKKEAQESQETRC